MGKMKTPIKDFLMQHASKNAVSFHMPGHKGSGLYEEFGYRDFLNSAMDCDITEITGADNLFQTEGIIRETMENYAQIYGVKNSYLLINGTSGGIIASILASVKKGHKLVMARNCHKSVFNALTLGEINPVYAYPEKNEEYGISGVIAAEEIARLLDENEDADAVILPSPNYYGICSDIKAIAAEVHRRNKVLIVDQAHGAHLPFFNRFGIADMPISAELAGADLVINSTHKTLASFTQSAVLNRNSERVDKFMLEDKLQCIESTSPSYVLMAGLDINAAIMADHGRELIDRWQENLNYFYSEAKKIKGLKIMRQMKELDWTKINLSFEEYNISGAELERILMEKYDIFIELFTGNLVMCMTGIGNSRNDFQRLIDALEEIGESASGKSYKSEKTEKTTIPKAPDEIAKLVGVPEKRKLVSINDSAGCICASSIIPYPPGIPFLCPGEEITAAAVEYIKELRKAGEKVIGVTDSGEVMIGND